MFKKVLVPLMLVAVLLLSACAQPTEAPTEAPPPTATPQPPEPTPEPEPEGLGTPAGDVILTVTGDIADGNVGDECQFDAAMFDQYAVDQTLDDPWMGDGLEYRGMLLSDIWELCGGSDDAPAAVMVASDGMTINIAKEDLDAWPIMVAYQVGGENLVDELGGPVKLVYPAEAGETYDENQWMWWLAEIQIGAPAEPEGLSAPTGDVILTVTGDIADGNVG
ncbi:MAG: molybdopterin-dependent oxidoreductase, partial [Chloroflexi bacterium]|nr:molybdopterin-dependent oxidoreductase [Chloroflexota bacterium]